MLGEKLWNGEQALIIRVSQADERAAWELFKRYNDKAFSFVVMERLGIQHAFAFDRHFEQIGLFVCLP